MSMNTSTETIANYVMAHTTRGECQCGRCVDKGDRPDPDGHTVDAFFFKVATANAPTVEELQRLSGAHQGEFASCDPFDGKEHSYIELGGWIGDQGLALQFMALGTLLGAFTLMTPRTMLPGMDEALMQQLAGQGMVAIQAKRA